MARIVERFWRSPTKSRRDSTITVDPSRQAYHTHEKGNQILIKPLFKLLNNNGNLQMNAEGVQQFWLMHCPQYCVTPKGRTLFDLQM